MTHLNPPPKALVFAFAILLVGAADLLLAQGTTTTTTTTGSSPWVNVVNELTTQFTGPIARGLSLIAIVIGGLMFAFGEGGSKRAMAGIIFGLGMGDGSREFPDLVVPMRKAKVWGAYPTLSKPLTIMGVERRWFMLSATLALAMWNAINSLVTGGMIFAVLYVSGWLAWKKDPNMLASSRSRPASRAATTRPSGAPPGIFGFAHDRQSSPRS